MSDPADLISLLVTATVFGKLAWVETDASDTYLAGTQSGSIAVCGEGRRIEVMDRAGDSVGLSYIDNTHEEYPAFCRLVDLARGGHSADGVVEAIQNDLEAMTAEADNATQ